MKAPEIPKNDLQRIQELNSFEILDTEEQEDFNFLTQMASKICGVSIAIVSLVDSNRQWFLSKQGLEPRETSREVSFCGHAILNPKEIFIIEDSTKDERFFDNPLVTGYPRVIFYAGVPLVTENGFPIGTLCVIDDQPRQLTSEQKDLLQKLAKQVINLLELRRKNLIQQSLQLDLKKNLAILGEMQKTNHIGAWEYDILTKKYIWTEEIYRICEVSFDFDNNKKDPIQFFHPDDKPKVKESFKKAIQENLPFDLNSRFISAKGNEKWVRSTGQKIDNKIVGSFQDITESKKTELYLLQSIQELKEAQKFSEKLLDNMAEGFSVIDESGRQVVVNRALCEMTGFSEKELIGHVAPYPYWPEEEIENIGVSFKEVLTNLKGSFELKLKRKNGERFPVYLSASALKNEAGEITNYFANITDITEQKAIQNKLKKTKDFLSQTSSVARVGGWEFDILKQTVEWTDSIKEIHEVPLDYQPTLDGIMSFFTPESKEKLQAAVAKAMQDGTGYELTLQIITAKGNLVWTRGIGNALFQNGQCVKLYGTFQDIDAQKKIEEELRFSLSQVEMFQGIIESSGDCFYMVDLENDGRMIYVNKASEKHFQTTRDKIYQWTIPDWDPNFSKEKLPQLIELVEKEKRLHIESKHRISNGSIVPVEITVNYVKTPTGQKIAYGWFTNISARLEAESELKKAKLDAEAASKAKSEFLANMSHEIRTPLNGVIGFTNLLIETELNSTQRKHLEIVNSSANSLLAIINDILDFSKIEAGMMNLEMIRSDLYEIFSESIDLVQYAANKKNIELLLDIDMNLPRFGIIDPVRLKQILANLLGNAVKFTTEGEVELKVKFEVISENKGRIFVNVRDTGIGINDEQRNKLFQSFSQADSTITRKFGGSGLGLIISQMLANAMGTFIEVKSQFGKGSEFFFSLDLEIESKESFDIKKISNIQKCLIIEDNQKNQKTLKKYLTHWGIEVFSVSNALDAISVIEKEKQISLIICDYKLPSANGLEVIQMIQERKNLSIEKLSFILLYTSTEADMFHKKCEELKINKRLLKPIKPTDLFYMICLISDPSFLSARSINKSIETTKEINPHQITILIADDIEANLELIKILLRKVFSNHIIFEAKNGIKTIEIYKEKKPDLILMDVQMPIMDGLEATKKIRAIEETTGDHVPIIALTAGALVEEQMKCMDAGMDDFLTKPIKMDKFKSTIQKFFPNKFQSKI